MYSIVLLPQAVKDLKKVRESHLKDKSDKILKELAISPKKISNVKKLIGNFEGAFSIRLNIQHRIVFTVNDDQKKITIVLMGGHYDE